MYQLTNPPKRTPAMVPEEPKEAIPTRDIKFSSLELGTGKRPS